MAVVPGSAPRRPFGASGATSRSSSPGKSSRTSNWVGLTERRTMSNSLRSTSTRTFVMWPVVAGLVRCAHRRPIDRRWLPLLLWGFLQYHLSGRYRTRLGGGGPGMSVPPDRLVTSGIYRFTRNPMYLGHLVFLAGLALATRSPVLGAVFGWHLRWFDRRAESDEPRLEQVFGDEYHRYRDRTPRWLPGLPSPPQQNQG